MRGDQGLETFSGGGCLGGELSRPGWERLAADLTRREVEVVALVGFADGAGEAGRSARLAWRWETEPGVVLPEFVPVLLMKRDMPSEGMEGSAAIVEEWLWAKEEKAPVELGLLVAEMVEVWGAME